MNRPRTIVRLAGSAAGLLAVVLFAGACADQPTEGGSDADPASEADATPTVRLDVQPDSESGWNIHVRATGFQFAPQNAGKAAKAGEGHAHLYVDGDKVARVYGPWYHLDADEVPKGEHTLSVELNGNDHSPVEADGEPVSDETTITSTGETGGGHDHGDGDAHGDDHGGGHDDDNGTDQGDDAEPDVEVDLTLEGGKVTPPPDSVAVETGDHVRLTVESDVADVVHVHGYDLERAVQPGKPAVLSFRADQTGRFEVETHDSGLLLTQLLVQ